MQGLVLKKNADLFTVECNERLYELKPSGKTRAKGIYVGDNVIFEDSITSVLPRKNLLIRPPVANIDQMFIVIAPTPKPDFVLVDKMLIYCALNDIKPIIVINKIDIADEVFLANILKDYLFYDIIKVSSKMGDLNSLKEKIKGICVLSGQSAVGKSSIINAIFDKNHEKTGELSKKTERGKQTTRIVTLYKFDENYIADTAGFSLLDLNMVSKIEDRELARYYPEFIEFMQNCKYRSCLHENGICGVLDGVKEGKISVNRYNNYLKILQELKNAKSFN